MKAMWLSLLLVIISEISSVNSAACERNQIYNGESCNCAPGYFDSSDADARNACKLECDETFSTLFTHGSCEVTPIGNETIKCNMKCVMKIETLAVIGLLLVFAAAIATLLFTLPLCITTCISCLSAKKANKNAKRVYIESQNQPSKDQQMQTMSYNPYAYWPYYGRS